jgi:hypothetical protein
VPIHPPTGRVAQGRPLRPAFGGVLDPAGHRRWWRNQDGLVALASDFQDAVAVFLAEVGDVRAAGFEDPQSEQAEHGDQYQQSKHYCGNAPRERPFCLAPR